MKVGYARVSTQDQDLSLQIKALEKEGCERIFTDKISGNIKESERKGLKELFDFIRTGDTLVIWKFDRLGRSVSNMIKTAEYMKEKGINLYSITEKIDTTSSLGKLFFVITAAFAEMEREVIAERTKAGQKIAKEKGKIFGRRSVFTEEKRNAAVNLLKNGSTYREVSKIISVSVCTLYRHIPVPKEEA